MQVHVVEDGTDAVSTRADLAELRRKAKPKQHATPGWKQAAE